MAQRKPKPWTAAQILKLRTDRDLLQKDAAAWLRVSQQLWAEWESGRRSPTAPMRLLLDLFEADQLPAPNPEE